MHRPCTGDDVVLLPRSVPYLVSNLYFQANKRIYNEKYRALLTGQSSFFSMTDAHAVLLQQRKKFLSGFFRAFVLICIYVHICVHTSTYANHIHLTMLVRGNERGRQSGRETEKEGKRDGEFESVKKEIKFIFFC